MAVFPNVCLWRRSLCSNLAVIDPEKQNCMEPFSYASTAYVVASALVSVRLFCKNLGNMQKFFGQMVYPPPPPAKNSLYAYDREELWQITPPWVQQLGPCFGKFTNVWISHARRTYGFVCCQFVTCMWSTTQQWSLNSRRELSILGGCLKLQSKLL